MENCSWPWFNLERGRGDSVLALSSVRHCLIHHKGCLADP